MSIPRLARVEDGIVREIIEPHPDADKHVLTLEDLFHEDYLKMHTLVECADEKVGEFWSYADGVFTAPKAA